MSPRPHLPIALAALLLAAWPGSAASQSTPAVAPAPPGRALRLVDLTGDGLADKLLMGPDGALAVAVNRGAGRFAPVVQDLPATEVGELLASDLDGDGNADLYLVSPGANRALLGDGTGRLFDATDALGLADAGLGRGAERLDLDGQGPLELVLHNAGGDVLFWARDGAFVRDPDSTPASGTAALGASELDQILAHFSRVWIDDGFGNPLETIRISGANLQIVSGLRATNGYAADPYTVAPQATATNGLGNLIVGYAEDRQFGEWQRTGSHNLIVGQEHSWSSYGGLLAGDANRVLAPYSSAAGGTDQTCSGLRSAVLGGQENVAEGEGTAILGGGYNCATGMLATASGGAYNLVPGEYAHVCAGEMNVASGITSCVVGGAQNEASGVGSAVLAGVQGIASAYVATVLGGDNNRADGESTAVVGGHNNRAGPDAFGLGGSWAVVLGGSHNQAVGESSTVAGGGGYEPVDGNLASGRNAAVSGGRANMASGVSATVGGGAARAATGDDDWVAGDLVQDQ